MSSLPRRISVSRSTALLVIEWDNGVNCEYPLSDLRAACPCAGCREEKNPIGPKELKDMLELPIVNQASTVLDRIEKVGNYAIQLFWRDGHSHGIYSWDYLRSLCPTLVEEP